MVAVTSMVGCHLIGGVTDLEYVADAAGGSGATSSGPSTGGGTAGGGGEGLTGPCESGDTIDCYTGPDGTRDEGPCTGGVAVCVDEAWGVCEGEVLPQPEICDNGIDEDCDGQDAPLNTTCLSDAGLVARYFIDEGMSGAATGQVFDSGPDGEHLQIFPVGAQPDWWVFDGGIGLRWNAASTGGRVSKSSSEWVMDELDGSKTATLEILVQGSSSNTAGLFIGGLWADSYQLSFWIDNLFTVYVHAGLGEAGRWSHPSGATTLWGSTAPPRLLHAVYDSAQADPAERLVLYVDGVRGTVESGPLVAQDQALAFPFPPTITFGNVPGNDNTTAMSGIVAYMAIYKEALSEDRIADHATILAQGHDGVR